MCIRMLYQKSGIREEQYLFPLLVIANAYSLISSEIAEKRSRPKEVTFRKEPPIIVLV
jgi:hypothetical protein